MITMKPVGYRILVEEVKRDGVTPLLIPNTNTELPFTRHIVRDVGQSRITANGTEVPIHVQIGDEVFLDGRMNSQILGLAPQLVGDRKFFIVDMDAVKAVLTGEPDRASPKLVTAKRIPALVH